MSNRRALVVGLTAVLVMGGVGGAWAASRAGHGDPDPGGRILAAAKTAEQGLPPAAQVILQQAVAPRWDSCDGRSETEGWSDVVVDVEFRSSRPQEEVLRVADAALTAGGWRRSQTLSTPLGPGAVWTRSAGGSVITASLSRGSVGAGIVWELAAVAPPDGRRVSGC